MLHIDLETYSSVDIAKCGAYKYIESTDFEILLIGYAFDDGPIKIVDLVSGDIWPHELISALTDPSVLIGAHNAVFERKSLDRYGFTIPYERWRCSSVKAGYCGYPLSLADVSKAMKLEEKGKIATGRALIKYFCTPCEPKKSNGMRLRNLPEHDPEKWELFRQYLYNDVLAEREIMGRLAKYEIPQWELENYISDQKINDYGIKIDIQMAKKAVLIDNLVSYELLEELKEKTGLDNPGSSSQMKSWLGNKAGKEIKSLAKTEISTIMDDLDDEAALDVLSLHKQNSKTSTKKYPVMLNCVCNDGRAHGLFQFYGATRTGRFAGRLIQLQNLPQNHLRFIETDRENLNRLDLDDLKLIYPDVRGLLSELIRTTFVAPEGHTFVVCDFSAIEARVLSWLAGEQWRLDVFNTHGKIYEASASMMFGVPIEEIGKGSPLRQKGKVAELALGYGGGVQAMLKMGADKMGLTAEELKFDVTRWRRANKKIVEFWGEIEDCAMETVRTGRTTRMKYFTFTRDKESLMIELPSGRKLFYNSPSIGENRFGSDSITFYGMDQVKKLWGKMETYGGKLTENVVQAVSRDLLVCIMRRLQEERNAKIVMHVHDEVVVEVPTEQAEEYLAYMKQIMSEEIPWAKGLPLRADGYITPFYKKD